jgi:WD40 repeat protein
VACPFLRVRFCKPARSGNALLTASADKTMKFFDFGSNVVIPNMGHFGEVNDAVFSPDERSILTAGDDRTARILRWQDREGRYRPVVVFKGHDGPRSTRPSSAATAGFVLTASEDDTARL